MKGKKTDPLFISNFITECINNGIDTPEDIVIHAKNIINEIDNQIKEVELKKINRSKLLDVIDSFEKENKHIQKEEVQILNFFKIQNIQICKYICDNVKLEPFIIKNNEYSITDLMFCIKQLIEYKIIYKSGNSLFRGTMFDEFIKSVLE